MGLEQPGLVEAVPVHGRRLDWIAFKGPFQAKSCCDSKHNLVVCEGVEAALSCAANVPLQG